MATHFATFLRRFSVLAIALFAFTASAGCAFRPPIVSQVGIYVAPPERCATLNDRGTVYTASAAGFAALAGAGGLSSLAVDGDARLGLGIATVAAAAFAAGAGAGARVSASQYVAEGCGAPAVKP